MEFGFVQERPERDLQRRRRARLVTSCDECRERKVKCVPAQPGASDERCEACAETNVRCEYKDKERYWAEKRTASSAGRSPPDSPTAHFVAGSRRASVSTGSSHSGRSDYNPSSLGAATYSEIESPKTASSSGSGSGWPSNSSSGISTTLFATRSPVSARWKNAYTAPSDEPYARGSYGMVAAAESSPSGHTDKLHALFDSQNSSYPHSALMPTFLYAFFHTYGPAYPFLNYDESIQKHVTSTLSPLLANVMAAMAAPYAIGTRELSGHNLQDLADLYMSNAKVMLKRYLTGNVSSSTLHSIILLAWSELARTPLNSADFMYYSELALQTATRFGLNQEATIQQLAAGNAVQDARLRATWACITQLFLVGPPKS